MAAGKCAGLWLRGAALNYGGGAACCLGAGSDIIGALVWLRCVCLIIALLIFFASLVCLHAFSLPLQSFFCMFYSFIPTLFGFW
jgi:hypothetical protein